VARGLDGPVPSRCVDAHFHVLRGSNPRPGLFPPCANRVFETRSIALSRSSHSVLRRHSSHSLVVLLLHWYGASAALQRTTACCCSGRDRNCEDRVGIGPRLDCVNVGYGELHWVNFDAGSNAHIGWLPFARSLPLRSVRVGPFCRFPDRVENGPRLDWVTVEYGKMHWVDFDAGSDARNGWSPFAHSRPLRCVRFCAFCRLPWQRVRRLPSLHWGKPSLYCACERSRHVPV